MQSRAQFAADVLSFPFPPTRKSLSQMSGAELDEVTQQPNQSSYLLLLFLLPRITNVLSKTLDPDVAIVNATKCSLYSSSTLRVSGDGVSPALLKEFYRVT